MVLGIKPKSLLKFSDGFRGLSGMKITGRKIIVKAGPVRVQGNSLVICLFCLGIQILLIVTDTQQAVSLRISWAFRKGGSNHYTCLLRVLMFQHLLRLPQQNTTAHLICHCPARTHSDYNS